MGSEQGRGRRYGMFVPEPFLWEGIRLLYGGIDAHDIARAVMAAVITVVDGGVRWTVCTVESQVPFIEEDGPQFRTNPLAVLDRSSTGVRELLRRRGGERLAPITEYDPMQYATQVLGFRPDRNFDE